MQLPFPFAQLQNTCVVPKANACIDFGLNMLLLQVATIRISIVTQSSNFQGFDRVYMGKKCVSGHTCM